MFELGPDGVYRCPHGKSISSIIDCTECLPSRRAFTCPHGKYVEEKCPDCEKEGEAFLEDLKPKREKPLPGARWGWPGQR